MLARGGETKRFKSYKGEVAEIYLQNHHKSSRGERAPPGQQGRKNGWVLFRRMRRTPNRRLVFIVDIL